MNQDLNPRQSDFKIQIPFPLQKLYLIKWVNISSIDLFVENFNPGHLELQNQILKLE